MEVITDDEKYFCFQGDYMPGSARYYTSDKAKCSDDVRFIEKDTYPKNILMWIAISNRGMSKPYFRLFLVSGCKFKHLYQRVFAAKPPTIYTQASR